MASKVEKKRRLKTSNMLESELGQLDSFIAKFNEEESY
jgi:hypothetical protein